MALSLGAGWFPAQHKGLAMGLVGAGNVGTAVSVLVAPPLAQWLGWQAVYAVAGGHPRAEAGDVARRQALATVTEPR